MPLWKWDGANSLKTSSGDMQCDGLPPQHILLFFFNTIRTRGEVARVISEYQRKITLFASQGHPHPGTHDSRASLLTLPEVRNKYL